MPKKIQKKIFDAQVMHSVGLARLEIGTARKIAALASASLEDNLKSAIRKMTERGDISRAARSNFNRLIRQAQKNYREFSGAVQSFKELKGEMAALANYEIGFQAQIFKNSFAPLAIVLNQPSEAVLRRAATLQPFQGSLLSEWQDNYARRTVTQATRAMRLAFYQGEGEAGLTARLLGRGGTRGVLKESRRGVEAISRTALNHAANSAKNLFYRENKIEKFRYTATIDARTTVICGSRDGQIYEDRDRPILPAHVNCRSTYVAVIEKQQIIGERSAILSKKTTRQLNREWRAESKATGFSLKAVRDKWYAENVGSVPAKTSFNRWLKGQSASFQKEYLGASRAALFRRGGFDLKDFLDPRGSLYTLKQLRRQDAGIFKALDL